MAVIPRPRRIGVFGGAFDPPHRAHVALAQLALAQLQLDQLRVIPTGQAWHKPTELSNPEQRLAMATLAFAGLPGAQVDDRETRRAGPSYTLDTLQELRTQFPEAKLFLMLGADQLLALPTWHQYTQILQMATIVVAERAALSPDVGSAMLALELAGAQIQRLALPPMPVSSSMVRAQVRQGREITELVPEAVARYIVSHRLYTSS